MVPSPGTEIVVFPDWLVNFSLESFSRDGTLFEDNSEGPVLLSEIAEISETKGGKFVT